MISRDTNIGQALRSRQRGFLLDPFRFGAGGGGSGSGTTWNPSDRGPDCVLSGGNLTASNTTSNFDGTKSTVSKTTGKWYWEVLIITQATAGDCFLGVCAPAYSNALRLASANPGGIYRTTGTRYKNASTSGSTFSAGAGDIVMFAWDAGAGDIWFGKNGSFAGDPVAGTGADLTGLSTAGMAACFGPDNDAGTTTVTLNCGAVAFAYSTPAGFSAL